MKLSGEILDYEIGDGEYKLPGPLVLDDWGKRAGQLEEDIRKIEINTDAYADENAALKRENEGFLFEVGIVRDAIGDRMHGAMFSECKEWYERLSALLADTQEGK